MNKRRNFRILLWCLMLGALVIDLVRVRLAPGTAKEVLKYVGITLIVAALVQIFLFRINPKSFRDKSTPPE